ncbi:MAG: hypothetical protein Q7T01_03765 [bacterium]|nr:hypothetical protein [bacterium]
MSTARDERKRTEDEAPSERLADGVALEKLITQLRDTVVLAQTHVLNIHEARERIEQLIDQHPYVLPEEGRTRLDQIKAEAEDDLHTLQARMDEELPLLEGADLEAVTDDAPVSKSFADVEPMGVPQFASGDAAIQEQGDASESYGLPSAMSRVLMDARHAIDQAQDVKTVLELCASYEKELQQLVEREDHDFPGADAPHYAQRAVERLGLYATDRLTRLHPANSPKRAADRAAERGTGALEEHAPSALFTALLQKIRKEIADARDDVSGERLEERVADLIYAFPRDLTPTEAAELDFIQTRAYSGSSERGRDTHDVAGDVPGDVVSIGAAEVRGTDFDFPSLDAAVADTAGPEAVRYATAEQIEHNQELVDAVSVLAAVAADVAGGLREGNVQDALAHIARELNIPASEVEAVLAEQHLLLVQDAQRDVLAGRAPQLDTKTDKAKFAMKTLAKIGAYAGAGVLLASAAASGGMTVALGGGAIALTRMLGIARSGRKIQEEVQGRLQAVDVLLRTDAYEPSRLRIEQAIAAHLAERKRRALGMPEDPRRTLIEADATLTEAEREQTLHAYGALQGVDAGTRAKEDALTDAMQEAAEQDATTVKKLNAFARLGKTTGDVLKQFWRGGDTTDEKMLTAGVFGMAGAIAYEIPVVRNVLGAYGGAKAMEAIQKMRGKRASVVGRIAGAIAGALAPEAIRYVAGSGIAHGASSVEHATAEQPVAPAPDAESGAGHAPAVHDTEPSAKDIAELDAIAYRRLAIVHAEQPGDGWTHVRAREIYAQEHPEMRAHEVVAKMEDHKQMIAELRRAHGEAYAADPKNWDSERAFDLDAILQAKRDAVEAGNLTTDWKPEGAGDGEEYVTRHTPDALRLQGEQFMPMLEAMRQGAGPLQAFIDNDYQQFTDYPDTRSYGVALVAAEQRLTALERTIESLPAGESRNALAKELRGYRPWINHYVGVLRGSGWTDEALGINQPEVPPLPPVEDIVSSPATAGDVTPVAAVVIDDTADASDLDEEPETEVESPAEVRADVPDQFADVQPINDSSPFEAVQRRALRVGAYETYREGLQDANIRLSEGEATFGANRMLIYARNLDQMLMEQTQNVRVLWENRIAAGDYARVVHGAAQTSPDMYARNLEEFKTQFPGVLREGRITQYENNIAQLRTLLGQAQEAGNGHVAGAEPVQTVPLDALVGGTAPVEQQVRPSASPPDDLPVVILEADKPVSADGEYAGEQDDDANGFDDVVAGDDAEFKAAAAAETAKQAESEVQTVREVQERWGNTFTPTKGGQGILYRMPGSETSITLGDIRAMEDRSVREVLMDVAKSGISDGRKQFGKMLFDGLAAKHPEWILGPHAPTLDEIMDGLGRTKNARLVAYLQMNPQLLGSP